MGINWLSVETYSPTLRCLEYKFSVELEVTTMVGFYTDQIELILGKEEKWHVEILQHVVRRHTVMASKCQNPYRGDS